MARPKKQFNKEQFEGLCVLQCTQEEICAFLNCDHKTLTRWCKEEYGEEYSQIYKKKALVGKISLRRSQMKLAERNPTMAIFLGKQWLGQTDKIEAVVSEIDNGLRNEIEEFLNDEGTGADT